VKKIATEAACTTCNKPAVVTTHASVGTVTHLPTGATGTAFVTIAGAARETAFAGLLAAAVGIAVYGVAAL
jgi:hypothetical protein